MKRSAWAGSWISCVLLAEAVCAAPARPSDGIERGLALARSGRCEEAIAILDDVALAVPQRARALYAAARCRIRLKRYAESAPQLIRLEASRPDEPMVSLYLGIALYHTGDHEGARRRFDRVRRERPTNPEAHLYQGLLALADGEDERAMRSFDFARALDRERTEPAASYYGAVARVRLGRYEEAREAAARVLALSPTGTWAEKARALLDRLALAWLVRATIGFEYDDNVVLRGDDVTLPSDISSQADERLIWATKGSAEFHRGRLGSIGGTIDYTGSHHDELDDFDVHYPGVGLWWRRGLGEGRLVHVEYRFSYAWVGDEPFVDIQSLGVTFRQTWDVGRSMARVRAFGYRYRDDPTDLVDGTGAPGDACPPGASICGAPGVDESERLARSGAGYEVSATHEWPVPWFAEAVVLNGVVAFQQYFAEGAEADYLRIDGRAGARVGLPLDVYLSFGGGFAYRPFSGKSSLPDPAALVPGVQFRPLGIRRRDRTTRVSAGLDRTFFERLKVEARYTYTDNDSSLPTSDFTRHVAGAYMTLQLGTQ